MRWSNHLFFFTTSVLRAFKDEQKRLHCQFRKENKELRELEMRIDSINIQVHEPLPVGEGKSVCAHCHHLRHRKPSTEIPFFRVVILEHPEMSWIIHRGMVVCLFQMFPRFQFQQMKTPCLYPSGRHFGSVQTSQTNVQQVVTPSKS